MTQAPPPHLAFIGGGNMASAILGGLIRQGHPLNQLTVIEPHAETRERLLSQFGITALSQATPDVGQAEVMVWAVKPQVFQEAAAQVGPHCRHALHLSVAAGIRSDSIARWLGTERVVRAMPNTPALVGLGQTGLFARAAVQAPERLWVERIMATTGQSLWVEQESLLDAVTAISGSGPAYVFFFIEAMVEAAINMGLSPEQSRQLAIGTFVGASELARSSDESPATLRERVTSKGGTTYAALQHMAAAGVADAFRAAMQAACERARELGDEFGK